MTFRGGIGREKLMHVQLWDEPLQRDREVLNATKGKCEVVIVNCVFLRQQQAVLHHHALRETCYVLSTASREKPVHADSLSAFSGE